MRQEALGTRLAECVNPKGPKFPSSNNLSRNKKVLKNYFTTQFTLKRIEKQNILLLELKENFFLLINERCLYFEWMLQCKIILHICETRNSR